MTPGHGRSWIRGFTLIELLTSVTIALTLTVLATVAFIQIRTELNRIHVRLGMHNSARFLHQSMSEQLSSLQQDAAMWLEATKDDGTGDGSVSITFLKGKTDEHGYVGNNGEEFNNGGEEYAIYDNQCCDLAWCSWKWDQHTNSVFAGTNSPPRQFGLLAPWVGPTQSYGAGNGNCSFMNMPQPLIQAIPYTAALPLGSSKAALSGNRYGTPDALNDISDYQDLQDHMSPVIHNVTGFVIEMVLSDGSILDANCNQTMTASLDGNFVNGQVGAGLDGSIPFKKRPRLIRIVMDLTDPQTRISQSFSFSFQPPGMLPSTNSPGNALP